MHETTTPRNKKLIWTILQVLNLLDKISTFIGVQYLGLHEANPIFNYLINFYGLIGACLVAWFITWFAIEYLMSQETPLLAYRVIIAAMFTIVTLNIIQIFLLGA